MINFAYETEIFPLDDDEDDFCDWYVSGNWSIVSKWRRSQLKIEIYDGCGPDKILLAVGMSKILKYDKSWFRIPSTHCEVSGYFNPSVLESEYENNVPREVVKCLMKHLIRACQRFPRLINHISF
jgi:hypothetical protein